MDLVARFIETYSMVIGWGLSPVDRLLFNILGGRRGPSPVPVISPPVWRRRPPPLGGPAPPPSVSVSVPVAVDFPVLVAEVVTCIAVAVVPAAVTAGATRTVAVAAA